MADDSNVRFVYRFGSATDDALTPRQKDLVGEAGSNPGLSVERSMPPQRQKAHTLDLTRLQGTGLAFVPDDESLGGRAEHGVIAPVTEAGVVDDGLLKEWAACRGTGVRHRFTQAILNALVPCNLRSEQ